MDKSLKLRSSFKLGMDFQAVWEKLYGIPLESFKGPCVWRSVEQYHREVIPKRFELIQSILLENSNIDLVLSYEHLLSERFLEYFEKKRRLLKAWKYKKESYALHEIVWGKSARLSF